MRYRVTFSDGKAHGGVKSGGVFSLKVGQTKTFSNITAGVLVTVEQVGAPSGFSSAPRASVEVSDKPQTVIMKSSYQRMLGT